MKNACRLVLIIWLILLSPLGFAAEKEAKAEKKQKFELIINGVKGKALENIKVRLLSKQNSIYPEQPDIVRWRYYLEASAEIKAAMRPYGYFRAKVKTHLERTDKAWRITADVTPGERLKFTQISVKVTGPGAEDTAFKNYLANLPIKVGGNFNSDHYERTKDTLQEIAHTRGYFKAKLITNKLVVNLEQYTSTVVIEFNTGPRYKFGQTQFSPSPFNESLLKSYLEYQPDQPYLNKKLEKSRSNLAASGFFQQVMMTPEVKNAHDYMVPVKTTITPQDQVVYSLGAGYGNTTGPRALGTMDLRWLNARGHSLKTLARYSKFNSTLESSYIIPGRHPAYSFYSVTAGASSLSQSSGTGQNVHTSLNYHNSFAHWHFKAALNYLTEKYNLNNYLGNGSTFSNDTSLLYPSVSLQRTYARKNILNPDYGYNISFIAYAGSRALGSRTSFNQFQLNTQFLYTLPTHTRILPRAYVGYTSINDLKNLPLSMQFYAGSYPSVRGFLYNQIGPGRAMAIGSFEVQQRVWRNLYAAGFVDAGLITDTQPRNSSDPVKPFQNQKFNVGTGPAIVYLSPIGALEVSVAKVVGADEQLAGRIGKWVVQFGLGVLL